MFAAPTETNVGSDQPRPGASPGALPFMRLETPLEWRDLVLPREAQEAVEGIRDLARRSAGTALFHGPAGTGKSLTASLLGKALGRPVLRVDLSAIVSKYIGETEKNLARAFDAAEAEGAVLLFDEAEALFGKRTEVKDAHDRYANIEAAYLLQRLERFQGLALFATSRRENIDPAFLRRLRFVVDFAAR
jgi:SpoVK/Ycf46/Vps4 family AAA+-type ATPase